MAKAKHVSKDTPVVAEIADDGETTLTLGTSDEHWTHVSAPGRELVCEGPGQIPYVHVVGPYRFAMAENITSFLNGVVELVADDPVTMETVIVKEDLELHREGQQP